MLTILIVVGIVAALIGLIVWVLKPSKEEDEKRAEIDDNIKSFRSTDTGRVSGIRPNASAVPRSNGGGNVEVDDGIGIDDIVIAATLLSDVEPVGDTPPPEDIGPYPGQEPAASLETAEVWDHVDPEPTQQSDPESVVESTWKHVDPEPASAPEPSYTPDYTPAPDPPADDTYKNSGLSESSVSDYESSSSSYDSDSSSYDSGSSSYDSSSGD
jgi:hypothetical protein